jgi:hypothetical protein
MIKEYIISFTACIIVISATVSIAYLFIWGVKIFLDIIITKIDRVLLVKFAKK